MFSAGRSMASMALLNLDAAQASVALLVPFLAAVLAVVARQWWELFARRYGRRHRLVGLVYLSWLVLGAVDCGRAALVPGDAPGPGRAALYDVVLGVLGTVLTLTAAWDFGPAHDDKHVNNAGSGTLSDVAVVTRSEMVEHAFYQGLNVAQALFVHALGTQHADPLWARLVLLACVTAPWAWRGRFPVNKFSANYLDKPGVDPWSRLAVMYRVKKYQYVFYKHFLLHGLNVSLALLAPPPQRRALGVDPVFRAYWVCLNAAYTMEFFLQTLVRRGALPQVPMLLLNKLLMLASSLAAGHVVVRNVNVAAAATSLVLNFTHRGHDVHNTALVAAGAWLGGAAWPVLVGDGPPG